MTGEQRTILSEKYVRRIKRFESAFLRPVMSAIHSQILRFIKDMKAYGIDHAKRNLDKVLINDRVADVINDIYMNVGLYSANKTLREVNKSAVEKKAGFGYNEEWINAIINYFKQYLLNKAVIPITDTTKQDILNVLVQAQSEGLGVDRIARELQSDELILWRARMIVRTESAKAMWYGKELADQKSEWETIDTWLSAKDSRVRHGHREMDGRSIPNGGRFAVPVYRKIGSVNVQTGVDYMTGPGDVRASAGNVINCRCTTTTRAARDERGRLIPKSKLQFQ